MADMDLNHLRDLAAEMVAALGPKTIVPPTAPLIDTPAALDRALSAALPGETIVLKPSFIYPGPLTIRKPVTLQVEGDLPPTRITRDRALPKFLDGITVPSSVVFLLGLEMKKINHLTNISGFTGAQVIYDRCRLLGDPVKGAKRGVDTAGNGNCAVIRSIIDDCFATSPGSDSQGVFAWDMAPGLLIVDNEICAGSESLLLGGSDNTSDARTPSNIIIRGNLITAKPEWMLKPIGVKTRVEFKNCRKVLFEKNRVEYCWRQGQTGYLFTASIRNQDGRAPWVIIEDVEVVDNDFAHGAAAYNILGREDIKEDKEGRPVPIGTTRQSGVMQRVKFARNRWTDLDPKVWTDDPDDPDDPTDKFAFGSRHLVQIGGGPVDLTIEEENFQMKNCSNQIYFQSGPKCDRFIFRRNVLPKSAYGINGVGMAPGKGWDGYVQNGILGPNNEAI